MIRPGQSPETVFGENNNLPFADVGKWLITNLGMKKILLICAILALIVGCASPRKYKENRFTKQFQEADSMFNQKYLLK